MKIPYPNLNILIQGVMAEITQKSNVDAFPLWSLRKQNGWVKKEKAT